MYALYLGLFELPKACEMDASEKFSLKTKNKKPGEQISVEEKPGRGSCCANNWQHCQACIS